MKNLFFSRRFILVAFSLAILLIPIAASAADEYMLLLSAATGTGPGAVKSPKEIYSTWACDVVLTGSPTSVVARLEGNQNGNKFSPSGILTITCTAAELAAGICAGGAASSPAAYIRPYVVTLDGGTNPTASMYCRGVK